VEKALTNLVKNNSFINTYSSFPTEKGIISILGRESLDHPKAQYTRAGADKLPKEYSSSRKYVLFDHS
jgi:hypothetical protein